MKPDTSEFYAYILAGGKSSRMGTDKAMLPVNKKEMMLHVNDVLKKVFDKIFIISDNPEHKTFGLEIIQDCIKDSGPAGGILTALNHSDRKYNFIVACDTPFVTRDAMLYVINHKGSEQITLPVLDNQMEPLFAVYTSDCKKEWQKLMMNGLRKLSDLILHFHLNKLDVSTHPYFRNSVLMNINTKEEYQKALTRAELNSQVKGQ